jgi:hypothetical protein
MKPHALVLLILLLLLPVATADAAVTRKKAIWGPVEADAASLFPTYRALGAGIYRTRLEWDKVAVLEPLDAEDPLDASYEWPEELDTAIAEGRQNRIEIAFTVTGTPDWAGGASPRDLAAFLTAAARRYPAVRLWMIGEDPAKTLSGREYARQLDAAYGALKARSSRNRVVGGNSSGNGAARWIRSLKLANGKRPRMDLYGHDAGARLSASALDALAERAGKRLFVDLSLPAGSSQASRLRAALRLARRDPDVYSLSYDGLYDEETRRTGLIDIEGTKRPAYNVFRRG